MLFPVPTCKTHGESTDFSCKSFEMKDSLNCFHGMPNAVSCAMKTNCLLPLLFVGAVLTLAGCASSNDDRPIPGTLESTSTKNDANENNTPRTNPTPNPEPASNPPGPQSDMHPVGSVPPQ